MAFNVGDQVKLVGTVKESVADKGGSSRVSVLIGTLDEPGKPSKEYWVNEADLAADPPEGSAAAVAAAETPETSSSSHFVSHKTKTPSA